MAEKEGALIYDKVLDPADGSSVSKLISWIEPNKTVLEIGPATGYMTRYLTEALGCRVTCIEIDQEAAALAQNFCVEMIVGNVEELDLESRFNGKRFDYIILADVLEHLLNPEATLEKLKSFLKKDGSFLCSIPNVGHSGVVLDLIRGNFDYRSDGLLDKTHFRFFTRKSVLKLFKAAGLNVAELDFTVMNPASSEFQIDMDLVPGAVQSFLKLNPDWNVYQFLVKACCQNRTAQSEAVIELPVTKHPPAVRLIQLYWDTGDGFVDKCSASRFAEVCDCIEHLRFEIDLLGPLRALRLDPLDCEGAYKLHRLSLFKSDEPRSVLEVKMTDKSFSGWGLVDTVLVNSGKELFLAAAGSDPGIILGDLDKKLGSITGKIAVELSIEYFSSFSLAEKVGMFAGKVGSQAENIAALEKHATALENHSGRLEAGISGLKREIDKLSSMYDESCRMFAEKEKEYQRLENEFYGIIRSKSWRLTAPLRIIAAKGRVFRLKAGSAERVFRAEGLRGLLKRAFFPSDYAMPATDPLYDEWIKVNTPSEQDLRQMRDEAHEFNYKPLLSVIFPVYNTKKEMLRAAIESVRAQSYPYWELCIADDASTRPYIREVLEEYGRKDKRIKIAYRTENGHISKASNSALKLAEGEFVILLDHDDTLAPEALFEVARLLNEDPSIDMIYSNEDKLDEKGKRIEPTFKAAWSPDYFLSFMYIGHLSCYRRSLVEEAGGFREGLEGSQDYDLALRVSEKTSNIRHIPKILYHWRKLDESVAKNIHAKPYAFKAARRALEDALKRRGEEDAVVVDTARPGVYRQIYSLKGNPKITVLLYPYKESDTLKQAGELVESTCYRNFNIVTRGTGKEQERIKIIEGGSWISKREFWKEALKITESEYVLLMDVGLKPTSGDWLERLLEHVLREGTAGCGPKIVSGRGKVLHAGYTVIGSKAFNSFYGMSESHPGYALRLSTVQNVSALSTRCLLIRKSSLVGSGVLSENYSLETAFDIDLSFSLTAPGGLLVWTPFSELVWSADGWPDVADLGKHERDAERLEEKHRIFEFIDPYYPPGLSRERCDYSLLV